MRKLAPSRYQSLLPRLGPGSNQLGAKLGAFQHIAHLTLAISLVWVAHMISHEYVEHESGRKGADRRKQFAALFDDAAKRKFDCVLFWALDRFSREGMAQTIAHLQRLVSYGVAFHSYINELVRNILLALLSSLAKL